MVRLVGLAAMALLLVLCAGLDAAAARGTGFPTILLIPYALALGAAGAALRCRTDRAFVLWSSILGGASVLLSLATVGFSARLATWGLAESLGLALLLASVVRAVATRHALPVALLLALALVLGPWRVGGTDAQTFTLLVALLATVVAAVGLLRRADDLRTTERLADLRQRERRAIARDLHDDLAHHVTGLVVTAQAARFGSQDMRALHTALEAVEEAGREALDSMRSIVGVLRDPDDEPLPLTIGKGHAPLQALADQYAAQTGVPVLVEAHDNTVDLPTSHRQAVLRITREALTNVRRHAREPRQVHLRLWRDERKVHLVIADDGHAGARRDLVHHAGTGFGLVGLRERAEVLGGVLQAGPDAAGGWRIQAELPLARGPRSGLG